jgi:hypothetical protein
MNSSSENFSSRRTKEAENNSLPEDKKEHPFVEIVRFSIIALIIVVPYSHVCGPAVYCVWCLYGRNLSTAGEYLIVDQVSYHLHDPARGDVIVFRYPKDPSKVFYKKNYRLSLVIPVKIEGSTVTIVNEQNPNGFIVDEPYIKSMSLDNSSDRKTRALASISLWVTTATEALILVPGAYLDRRSE